MKWNYRTGVFKKAGKNLLWTSPAHKSMYIHSVYWNIIVSVIHATFQWSLKQYCDHLIPVLNQRKFAEYDKYEVCMERNICQIVKIVIHWHLRKKCQRFLINIEKNIGNRFDWLLIREKACFMYVKKMCFIFAQKNK